MKNTKICPKCGSSEILRFNGSCGAYGAGNNMFLGTTVFSAINVNRYVCTDCGFTEEWIDKKDLAAVKKSRKGNEVN